MSEGRTERTTIRWPEAIRAKLSDRANNNGRSISAEVRELLTYARNTIQPNQIIPIASYPTSGSTSICLTPRLRHWLESRVQYNDRTLQIEILSLVTFALADVMEREIEALARTLAGDQAKLEPGQT